MRIFTCSLPEITCINCVQPAINALIESSKIKVTSVKPDIPAKTITIFVEDDSTDNDTVISYLRDEIEGVGVSCESFKRIIHNQMIPSSMMSRRKNPDSK
jgi:copper chaperone CopZ